MPTASTSQILGNNECFEPYTSNVYIRRTLAGEFVVINHHLLKDLLKLGIWTDVSFLADEVVGRVGELLGELGKLLGELMKLLGELVKFSVELVKLLDELCG